MSARGNEETPGGTPGRVYNAQRREQMLRIHELDEQSRLQAERMRRERRVFHGGRGAVGGAAQPRHEPGQDAKIAKLMQINPDMSFLEAKDMAQHVPWEALVEGGECGSGGGGHAAEPPNDVRSRRTLTLAMQRSARDREKRERRERQARQEKAAEDAIIAKKMKLARDKADQNRLRKLQAKNAQMKEAPKIRAKRMKRFQQQQQQQQQQHPLARSRHRGESGAAASSSSQHQRFENPELYDADFEMALAMSSRAYRVSEGRRQGHAGEVNGGPMAVSSAGLDLHRQHGVMAAEARAAWGVQQLPQNSNPGGRTGAGAGGLRGSAAARVKTAAPAAEQQPLGLAQRNSDLRSQVTRMKQEIEALKTQLLEASSSSGGSGGGGGSGAAAAGVHPGSARNDHIAQVTSESWGYLLAISDDHALIQAVLRFLHEDAVHVSANGGRPASIDYAVSVCTDQRRAAAATGPSSDFGGNAGGDGGKESDEDEDMEPAPLNLEEMREQRLRALQGGGGGGAWNR